MFPLELVDTIRKMRLPDREIGGRILDGKIVTLLKSYSHFTIGTYYFMERYMTQLGYITFHTHPKNNDPSGSDFIATYIRGYEVIFCEDHWIELYPKKVLPISTIQQIDEKLWREAQIEEVISGNPAYWIWKGLLRRYLPVKEIKHKY